MGEGNRRDARGCASKGSEGLGALNPKPHQDVPAEIGRGSGWQR
jgi:hypothetical protein